jgi:hypothetical protein
LTAFLSFQEYLERDAPRPLLSDDRAAIGYSEAFHELYDEDRLFLARIFANLHNSLQVGIRFPPCLDEVTKAFWTPESTSQSPPLWVTFALQVMLDIRHTLQDQESRAFIECQAAGE